MGRLVTFTKLGKGGGEVSVDADEVESVTDYRDGHYTGVTIKMKTAKGYIVVGEAGEVKAAIDAAQTPAVVAPEQMTLRDHFAVAVLPRLLMGFFEYSVASNHAYQIADTMLEARSQKGGQNG